MGRTLLKHIPFFKPYFPDRLLQTLSNLFPNQMPKRLDDYYEVRPLPTIENGR